MWVHTMLPELIKWRRTSRDELEKKDDFWYYSVVLGASQVGWEERAWHFTETDAPMDFAGGFMLVHGGLIGRSCP